MIRWSGELMDWNQEMMGADVSRNEEDSQTLKEWVWVGREMEIKA